MDLYVFTVEHLNRLCRHSLTLVPRELLDVCLQTRQSLCDMPAGSLWVSLCRTKKSTDGCEAVTVASSGRRDVDPYNR